MNVIIDNGSGSWKAGLTSDSPLIVTAEREANVKRPIERGLVADWVGLTTVYHRIFDELGVSSEECSVLLTENPLNPKKDREKMTELMFETFHTRAAYLASTAQLALYYSGSTTGLVFDSGEDVSTAVAVYEGCSLPQSIIQLNIAGGAIATYLSKLLAEAGHNFPTLKSLRYFKEQNAYVALDFIQEMEKNCESQTYELPDGKVITAGNERFRCAEALFCPSFLGMEENGVETMLYESIMKCDPCIRKEFFYNIVLAGGNTLLSGFEQRLDFEIKHLVNTTGRFHHDSGHVKVQISAPPEQIRKYSAWYGGVLLASLNNQSHFMTRAEYDECGPSLVHRKCF